MMGLSVRAIFSEDSAHAWLRLAARIERRLLFHNQWFIHVDRMGHDPMSRDMSTGFDLMPPHDRFWADPFLWLHEGRLFVFVEELEFSSNKGRISVIECDAKGRIAGCRTVLQAPWHLSYPFLFEWQGGIWMLPESGASGRITLYRCERFPDRWVEAKVLMNDVRSADPTLVEHEGRWWLFVNIATVDQSIHGHLHLFSAASPLGPFEPHPKSPVCEGLTGTRPAGPLFSWHGALYRPAQDCGRVYGKRTMINRVSKLTTDDYVEVPVATIEPGWAPRILKTHTLCVNGEWRVVDAMRLVPRLARHRSL